MVSRVAAWVCALSALSFVGGCGKAEGGAVPIQKQDLPSRVANLICDSRGSCCKSAGFAFDAAACKAEYAGELEQSFNEELDSARVEYDAQAAGDCLAQASPIIQCGEVDGDTPACERIFHGKLALGQPCSESRECKEASGQHVVCTSPDGLSPEVCTSLSTTSYEHGKAGDACLSTCSGDAGDDCDFVSAPTPTPGPGVPPEPTQEPSVCYRSEGLYCDFGACAPLVALNFSCGDSQACAGKAFCDFNTQLCTSPRADGQPCQGDSECQSDSCNYTESTNDPGFGAGTCGRARTVTASDCATENPPAEGDTVDPAPGSGTP